MIFFREFFVEELKKIANLIKYLQILTDTDVLVSVILVDSDRSLSILIKGRF